MKFRIKKGDEVVVIAGADKGRRGEVLEVNRKSMRVKIEGVAMCTIHKKARNQEEEGGIFQKEGTVHYSNVMLAERYDARHNGTADADDVSESAPAAETAESETVNA